MAEDPGRCPHGHPGEWERRQKILSEFGPLGPSFSYRTVVRPSYKVMYKTVTAREWRCCPGHSGVNCEEGRTTLRCRPVPSLGRAAGAVNPC